MRISQFTGIIILIMMCSLPVYVNAQSLNSSDSTTRVEITDDAREVCDLQKYAFDIFTSNIMLYRKTTGHFPESMHEFVKSGFPIFWPRDMSNGLAAFVVDSIDHNPDDGMIGAFHYDVDEFDTASLDYVNYDKNQLHEYNHEYLDVFTYWLSGPEHNNFLTMDVPENRITQNTPFAEYENISVFAGLKRIDEIGDYDSRVIYAFSGQFGNFFITKSNDFYTLENRIPKSLTDLLDTTGSTQLVITDNFNYFAELLEDSDAVFKCGYDDDLDVVYVHLEINGELLISYCHALDRYESSIEIESVNMENPIISNENISEIKIPTGYLISLRDVPAGI